jgi:UTP--glucose-1-phosphate uridylyltransferase
VFTPGIYDELKETPPGTGGEYQLTDGIRRMLSSQRVLACRFRGTRFDTGDKLGYIRAILHFAIEEGILSHHPVPGP